MKKYLMLVLVFVLTLTGIVYLSYQYIKIKRVSSLSTDLNIKTPNLTSVPTEPLVDKRDLTKVIEKELKYNGTKINIYTYKDSELSGYYLVKQDKSESSGWGNDGTYSYALLFTKHPFFGIDGSYADIEGDNLVAVNATTNTVSIYKIITENLTPGSTGFTLIKTIQLTKEFAGVPFYVSCKGNYTCDIGTAVHFEGGCMGNLSLSSYTFSSIKCK